MEAHQFGGCQCYETISLNVWAGPVDPCIGNYTQRSNELWRYHFFPACKILGDQVQGSRSHKKMKVGFNLQLFSFFTKDLTLSSDMLSNE